MSVPLKDRRRTVYQVIEMAFADEQGRLPPDDEELFRQIIDLVEKRPRGHMSPALSDLTKRRDLLDAGPSMLDAINLIAYATDCMAMAAQVSSAATAVKLRELRQDFLRAVSSTAVAPPPQPIPGMPPATDVPD